MTVKTVHLRRVCELRVVLFCLYIYAFCELSPVTLFSTHYREFSNKIH